MLNRGSVRRKWDLHIHAPTTVHNNQFLGENDDEKRENYLKRIEELEDISVLWITDYFSIEGYKKLLSFKESGRIANIDLLIPNIELRILPVTQTSETPINLHILISPEIADRIDDLLFSKLTFSYIDEEYQCTRTSLIALGKKVKGDETLHEKTAYEEWVTQFKTDITKLKKILDSSKILKNNVLVGVSNSNQDGNSWIGNAEQDASSLQATREEIYRFSDFIFSGRPADRTYLLWEGSDSAEIVINKYGSIKPCLHGSDAHDLSKICNPDLSRFTRIKANPTFLWLKQVIYEPKDRVMIQETRPYEKDSYQTINSFKFIDNDFLPQEIPLNEWLVTIIWWKSTGKSLLLRNIAQTIDQKQVEERLDRVKITKYKEEVDGFEITWRDGQKNEKSMEGPDKKIIYIPQSYLNRLIDEWGGRKQIDEIIENVLRQEASIKEIFESIKTFQRENQQKLTKAIDELFFLEEDISQQIQKIKNVWDKKWIEQEIRILSKEVSDMKAASGISKEDIAKYNELWADIKSLKAELNIVRRDKEILKELSEEDLFYELETDDLSEPLTNKITIVYEGLVSSFSKEWAKNVDSLVKEISGKETKFKQDLEQKNQSIKPLKESFEQTTVLQKKMEKLEKEQEKQKLIEKESLLLKELRDKFDEKITILADLHNEYYKNLFEAKAGMLTQTTIANDIDFHLEIRPLYKNFRENFIEDYLNLKKLSSFTAVDLNDEYVPASAQQFELDVRTVIGGIVSWALTLKSRYTSKEALTKLLSNRYEFDYKISQNGDSLSDMSPWKKSFVLLKLLIELDNSTCPILLDQPEDDLDNRSIYSDLVKFIREKKKYRQIIIATHNPNLVVWADAEQVIVANQHGTQNPNENFKFEYIADALENDFVDMDNVYVLHSKWIQQHVCDILEWGKTAFEKRKNKYNFQV